MHKQKAPLYNWPCDWIQQHQNFHQKPVCKHTESVREEKKGSWEWDLLSFVRAVHWSIRLSARADSPTKWNIRRARAVTLTFQPENKKLTILSSFADRSQCDSCTHIARYLRAWATHLHANTVQALGRPFREERKHSWCIHTPVVMITKFPSFLFSRPLPSLPPPRSYLRESKTL